MDGKTLVRARKDNADFEVIVSIQDECTRGEPAGGEEGELVMARWRGWRIGLCKRVLYNWHGLALKGR